MIYTVVLVSGIQQSDLVIQAWLLNRWKWLCTITNYRGFPHPWAHGSTHCAINWSENIYCCYLRVFGWKGFLVSQFIKNGDGDSDKVPVQSYSYLPACKFSDIDTNMIMGSPQWKHSFQLSLLVLLFWRLNFPRWDAKSFLSLHIQGF